MKQNHQQPKCFKQWLAKHAFHRHPSICTYYLFQSFSSWFLWTDNLHIMQCVSEQYHAGAAAEVFVFGSGLNTFSETLEGNPPTHYQLDPSCRAACMTARQAAAHPAPGERCEWRWPVGPLPFNGRRDWRGGTEGELKFTQHHAWHVAVCILEPHNETNRFLGRKSRSPTKFLTNFFQVILSLFFILPNVVWRCLWIHQLCFGCVVTAENHDMPETWVCSSVSFHSLIFIWHHCFFLVVLKQHQALCFVAAFSTETVLSSEM